MISMVLLGTSFIVFLVLVVFVLFFGFKIVNHYENGVRFTLGRYTGVMQPGLRFVFPVIQTWERVDLRTKVKDVPDQDCITKDNVSVNVNAVLYYAVVDANKVILEVEHYQYVISQLAQTTMRDVVGEVTLDELLSKRDDISKRIKNLVDKATDPWGIKVESVELKHIELPEEMKRVMAKQAEAEREKRAVIIKASGEVTAAANMAKAANMLAKTPGALHLRTLHSINDLSSDKSNTMIYALPAELLRMIQRMGNK
ncbi:slipin family protein [Candidatus Woesearchaeota archaeon]|nr:slipin family protein [Candidatus Woesearchaeota archaeon]